LELFRQKSWFEAKHKELGTRFVVTTASIGSSANFVVQVGAMPEPRLLALLPLSEHPVVFDLARGEQFTMKSFANASVHSPPR